MPTCPQCGNDLKHKQGVSKKNGKPYNFWGCTAYPECRYTTNQPPGESSGKQVTANQTIANTLEGMEDRLKTLEKSIIRTEVMVEKIGKMVGGLNKNNIPVVDDGETSTPAQRGDHPW